MNRRCENGYSLIEIMVVIMIIGILFTLSIVTYAGIRNSGYDTKAKTNLSFGVTAARIYYTEHESSYTNMNASELAKLLKEVNFGDGDINSDYEVYVSDVTADGFVLSCRSASGIVFTATGGSLGTEYNF